MEPLVLHSVPLVQRLQRLLSLMMRATSLKHTRSVWSKYYWNKMPAYDRIVLGSWKSLSQITFKELCFCMEMGFGSIKCHSLAGLDFRLKTDEDQVLCPPPLCPPQAEEGINYYRPKWRPNHSNEYFSLMKTELLFSNLWIFYVDFGYGIFNNHPQGNTAHSVGQGRKWVQFKGWTLSEWCQGSAVYRQYGPDKGNGRMSPQRFPTS